MGQDQSSALVPARPLPGTSTLRDLCEVDYTVTYESSDDVGMVVNALKCLGFVLVKNVFEPHELAEIQPTVSVTYLLVVASYCFDDATTRWGCLLWRLLGSTCGLGAA